MDSPIIGITPDVIEHRGALTCRVALAYASCVERAGGVPVVLSPRVSLVQTYASRLDAVVFTGGDDPIMEDFGVQTHPEAVRVHTQRQAFETALMQMLREHDVPALGICLGMQYMGLMAGGTLDQHIPETSATAADHWEAMHPVRGLTDTGWTFGDGLVHSKHRQAITDAGSLDVLATAEDGTIEALGDGKARFWIGVQWHPERTDNKELGQALFDALIKKARTE